MVDLFNVPPEPDTPDRSDEWDAEKLAAELQRGYNRRADLSKDALLLYEPQDYQQAVHACRAKNVLITGGVRCLAGWQEIYDPVLDAMRRIDSIDGEFHVLSRNPHDGSVFVAKASRPFIKARGTLCKFTLSTGDVLYATREHRVLDDTGRWVAIGRAYDESICLAHQPVGEESRSASSAGEQFLRHNQFAARSERVNSACTSTSGPLCSESSVLLSVATAATSEVESHVLSGTPTGFSGDSQAASRRRPTAFLQTRSTDAPQFRRDAIESCLALLECGEGRQASIWDTGLSRSLGGAGRSMRTVQDSQADCLEDRRLRDVRPRVSQAADQSSSPSPDDARELDRPWWLAGDLGRGPGRSPAYQEFGLLSSKGGDRLQFRRRAVSECRASSSPCEPVLDHGQGVDQSDSWTDSSPSTDDATLRDSIQFALTHPARFQLKDTTSVIVSSMEVAGHGEVWDLTVDGYANYLCAGLSNGNSGKTLVSCIEDARCVTNQDPYKKYPKTGRLILLGFGWKHIGNVFYPMLFRPGAFKIIRDKQTKKWRSFRPWLEEDLARESECEPAPPLIHPRFYDPRDIAWEYRGQDQISKVKLNTGWEIWAFSSESDPDGMQGFQADRVHTDEDVNKERFIDEAQSRLTDRKGCFCWSAMPHSRNHIRVAMSEKAAELKENNDPDPLIVEFTMPFTANRFIDEKTKKQKLEEWALHGEDVLRMRAYGHYTFNARSMYPTFHLKFHGYKRSLLPNRDVPKDWTRFAAIDPGHSVCAVVFGAIPPDNSMCLVYDELRIEHCDAAAFGDRMREKCQGYEFQAFIIDAHGARLRDMGGGRNAWDWYQEALEERGVKCRMSGSSFTPGVDVPRSRAESLRMAMRDRGKNDPYFRVLVDDDGRSEVPVTTKSLPRFRKKTDPRTDAVLDEPETRGDHVHHCQVVEYLFAYHGLKYVKPEIKPDGPNWVELMKKQFDDLLNSNRKRRPEQEVVHFGASSLYK